MKISTRLVLLTALLVAGVVSLVVWQWASTDRANMLAEEREDAVALARTLSRAQMNEIDDSNWKQIANNASLIVADNAKVVYIIYHGDARHDQRIIAAAPKLRGAIPDIVPIEVTRAALAAGAEAVVQAAPLLRDIPFKAGIRARKGERIVEAAVSLRTASNQPVGIVRVAVSTAAADEAANTAILRALKIGGAVFLIALLGAVIVARTLARPIERLAVDVHRIAAGDLGHRAQIAGTDEIGTLAAAFNNMSHDLELSFGKLRDTAASFQRFVPEKFLAVVAPEGLEKIKIGTAAPRKIAVLFSDIRGFTKMSEQMTPAQVFDLLNVYLARMGGAIDKAGGFVDKYIGDAIMALFDDEHTDGLLRAIVGMREALVELNKERVARGEKPIESGIGAHGGDVVMGTIGFASKIESTVIGDPVNVASRVEGMTKDHQVAVLITGDVVARVKDRAAFPLRLLAEKVAVRGRVDPIDLYTLDV